MTRLFACLLLVVCWSIGFAQMDMGSMFEMQSSPTMALSRPDVKKELKLRKDQDAEISKIEKEFQTSGRNPNDFSGASNPFEKLKDSNERVLAILDDGQKKRLLEIRIQMLGAPATIAPEVVGQLGLSDDQIAKIKDLKQNFADMVMGQMSRRPDQGTLGRLEKARDERDANILAVLNDEQKAKFKEMQGAVFKNARQKGSIF